MGSVASRRWVRVQTRVDVFPSGRLVASATSSSSSCVVRRVLVGTARATCRAGGLATGGFAAATSASAGWSDRRRDVGSAEAVRFGARRRLPRRPRRPRVNTAGRRARRPWLPLRRGRRKNNNDTCHNLRQGGRPASRFKIGEGNDDDDVKGRRLLWRDLHGKHVGYQLVKTRTKETAECRVGSLLKKKFHLSPDFGFIRLIK